MDRNEQFRLFISLALPDGVQDGMEAAQTEIAKLLPGNEARWTRRGQFHLTLVFLGNVAADRVEPMIAAGRDACRSFGPLRVTAARVGFFPDAHRPRVLWVGVDDMAQELNRLWRSLKQAMRPFTNEAGEKDYVGHITLARLNRLTRMQTDALAKGAAKFQNTVFGNWTADHLELMRSELLSQGARHTVLAQWPLSGGDR